MLQNVKDQLAAAGGGINLFLQTHQPDLLSVQQVDDFNQMFKRMAQPSQFPNNRHIAETSKLDALR